MPNKTTISKVRTKNAKRSPKAKAADYAKTAKRTVGAKNARGLREWMKDPGALDVRGVDTRKPAKTKAKAAKATKKRRATKKKKSSRGMDFVM